MKVVNFDETPSLMSRYLLEMRSVDMQRDPLRFRRNLERAGEIMAYEISKTMKYKKVEVQTPLDVATCDALDEKVVLGTIFRAGVPFHQGFLSYFDSAENAFVSAYRKYKEKENFDILIEYLAPPRGQDPDSLRPDAGHRRLDGAELPGFAHQGHSGPRASRLGHSVATGR